MKTNPNNKPHHRPRIGLYSVGLKAYWSQFPGLLERLKAYGLFIEQQMSAYGEVFNFGMVDHCQAGQKAGEFFNSHNVDIIFLHCATYVTSDTVLPVHLACQAPLIILNLQPAPQVAYAEMTTGEWLSQCTGCCVPEIANALTRGNIPFHIINGLLGLTTNSEDALSPEISAERPEAQRAWQEINQYLQAALVKRTLTASRFGFLGNYYSGMLDLYSDFTLLQAQTGIHIEMLEMCDLAQRLQTVTPEQQQAKLDELSAMFIIAEGSASEPLACRPSQQQLDWACKVAVALDELVNDYELDALSYYYHGSPDNDYEKLQAGGIVGYSLLTARGIPCAGEADIKTNLAMKIADLLGVGGSFSEIVITDYLNGTILMGHDGPFHISIAAEKPLLRGLGLYHGKQGTGVSVEAKVRSGPITLLGCTQTVDGKLKLIISEGEATNAEIMQIGNTQTQIKFPYPPDQYYDRWFAQAPTHHAALSIGHNAGLFTKTAELLNIPYVII